MRKEEMEKTKEETTLIYELQRKICGRPGWKWEEGMHAEHPGLGRFLVHDVIQDVSTHPPIYGLMCCPSNNSIPYWVKGEECIPVFTPNTLGCLAHQVECAWKENLGVDGVHVEIKRIFDPTNALGISFAWMLVNGIGEPLPLSLPLHPSYPSKEQMLVEALIYATEFPQEEAS